MLADWIREAWAVVQCDPNWGGWDLQVLRANDENSFSAQDFHSVVAATMGPVVVLGTLKRAPLAILAESFKHRIVVIHREDVVDSTDVHAAFVDALERHDDGDPQVPELLVVAALLVRKLLNNDCWGGEAKNKAFMWADDLASGRGVDIKFRGIVNEVANQLQLKGLLITKKSQGKKKYALNPDRREDIHAFLERMAIPDDSLRKYLYGSRSTLSARELDRIFGDQH